MSSRSAQLALVGALVVLVLGGVAAIVTVQERADRVVSQAEAYTLVQQRAGQTSGAAVAALRRVTGARARQHADRLVADAERAQRQARAGDLLVVTMVWAARRMRDSIAEQEDALARYEGDRATVILIEKVGPAYDGLQRLVVSARGRQLKDADAAARRADRLSAAVLVLVAIAGSLLAAGWLRLRRRADIAAFAHTRARTFQALARNASDIVSVIGEDGIVTTQAGATSAILGRRAQELVRRPFSELVHPEDRPLMDTLLAEGRVEWRLEHAGGGWVHVDTQVTDLRGDPNVAGLVLTTRDMTERKALEARLRHQAFHDPLTELPNRALFFDRLAQALRGGDRGADAVAALFIDIDDFKATNDELGHAAGDGLLTLVARRLEGVLRPADTVARLGGDEFGVLIQSCSGPAHAVPVAERILSCLAEPLEVAGTSVVVAVSIGIATSAGTGVDAEQLLHAADMAMYEAKRAGKNRFAVHELAPGGEVLAVSTAGGVTSGAASLA